MRNHVARVDRLERAGAAPDVAALTVSVEGEVLSVFDANGFRWGPARDRIDALTPPIQIINGR